MQCPECQHENAPDAKFCDHCGTPFAGPCSACGMENRPGARFCKGCGTALTAPAPSPTPSQPTQPQQDAGSRFQAILPAVTVLLQHEKRILYRELKHIFGLDDVLLEEIREALRFKRLAVDEDGAGLVWTGEAQPAVPAAVPTSRQEDAADTAAAKSPAVPALPSPVTETGTPSNGPTAPSETLSTGVLHDEPFAPEPMRPTRDAERRQLTVMFCDLADSTKLSQQLDPEDLREVVRAYQETAVAVIHQYEGHIAQYLGDGLLIYFGWPVAHEDDAQRSLHAGLGIVEAITTTLNLRLEAEKGVQLTVRLGVHTGPVVVGEMGGGGRHENLATGETVNIAARLEGLAAPNTVVISSATARLVDRSFALESLGPQRLKGVAEPMEVFRVLGRRDIEPDEEESVPDRDVFLLGRDEEVGLLLRRWEQAKESLGQVVLIRGEAGIGKSSLVATVRQQVVQAGYTRLTFRCSPYHTNSALYPVIEHVQRVLQWQPGDTPATRLDKLERVLKGYSRPLEEVVPLVAALLSVPVPEERYPALNVTPQQQRQQTLDTLVAWLLEEAEKRPVLVAWEDLHWADPSTLEMLGLVLEQTPTVPMLHVLTYRPEFDVPWPTRSHMTPITLNRLERPQVKALITHLAGGKTVPDELVQHIVVKTDGVPLYVEELTKMLLESDLLREEAEAYVLTGPLLSVTIPDTLQDSLMARLDQLHTAKEVAQLGAVLGREFPYELIQAISSQDDETLQAGLAQLVEAELLYQRGRPPRARYIFKHALIQDAAYASLLRSTRQRAHQQIAQVLEVRFPAIMATQPELLAHHFAEAGFTEQAVDYWQRAGEQAAQRSAHVEAIAHLTKGLELVGGLSDSSDHKLQELTLQRTLGASLLATKGFAASEVEAVYTRAREICIQIEDTSHIFPILFGLWGFHQVKGASQTARELAEELLALAQRNHDPALVMGYRALGDTLDLHGEFVSSRAHLEQGIALYDIDQHHTYASLYGQDPLMGCRVHLARVLWLLGYPDQALQMSEEAIIDAQQLGHTFSLAFALNFTCGIHKWRGEWQALLERAETLITLCTEEGFAQQKALAMVFQGHARVMQGDEDALAQVRQAMTANKKTGASMRAHVIARLAEMYLVIGEAEEAQHVVIEGLATSEETGECWHDAELHRLRGESLLALSVEHDTEAETCFHQALDVARHQHAKSWELRAATSLARLWQSQGKRQEAYELLAPVYEWFTEGFNTTDLKDAKALLQDLEPTDGS